MKKALLITIAVLAASFAATAPASERSFTVVLAGGPEDNSISIALSDDGREYVITSIAALEVGGSVCTHPEDDPFTLTCAATKIGGFEVNGNGGGDTITVAREVPVPTTLRGGPGDDRLVGGAGNDKLVGGAGDDVLIGRGGNDWLYGGPGNDRLLGGPGNDLLRGGPGLDQLFGGSGRDDVRQ